MAQIDVVTMWHLQYSYSLLSSKERLCVVEASDIDMECQMACGQCGTLSVVWYDRGWCVVEWNLHG